MKEESKRLLRGMTEVSDQYILEAEAFYQNKEEQDLVSKNRESLERERIEKESINRESIEKDIEEKENIEGQRIEKEKKIIKMQEAKKRKFITLPRVLGFTASIAAACFVCYIGVFMFFADQILIACNACLCRTENAFQSMLSRLQSYDRLHIFSLSMRKCGKAVSVNSNVITVQM